MKEALTLVMAEDHLSFIAVLCRVPLWQMEECPDAVGQCT